MNMTSNVNTSHKWVNVCKHKQKPQTISKESNKSGNGEIHHEPCNPPHQQNVQQRNQHGKNETPEKWIEVWLMLKYTNYNSYVIIIILWTNIKTYMSNIDWIARNKCKRKY